MINYSEGNDTAAVTSGLHSKALRVLRSAQVGYRPPLSDLIIAVQEIENLALEDQPLDIEYAVKKNGQIVTFQVRPLPAVNKPEDGIGDDEIFDGSCNL